MKYRSRLQIIADILNIVRRGSRKTRIMYLANLSYMLLEKYLGETVASGFVSRDKLNYRATEKGLDFLEKYKDFSSRYSKVSNELRKMQLEKESLEKLCVEPKRGRNNLRGRKD